METAIIVQPSQFIAPITDMNTVLQAYQNMKDFVSGVLRKDIDFGAVPGTGKPTLLKPGAEKLSRFFGLSIRLEEIVRVEDWTGSDHNGEAFFFYRYKALAMRGEAIIAEGIGSCSSWEKKYRYRQSERVCPKCGRSTIIAGKAEYGGGYICFVKKGGCGAKFRANDEAITSQQLGQVVNPDSADLVNTIDKMAQKRAIVAVVLLACNASEYFTQDVEDYIDTSFVQEEPPQKNQQPARVEVSGPDNPVEIKLTIPDHEPTPDPELPSMSIETARSVKSSDGRTYGEIEDTDPQKIDVMPIGINKGLNKATTTPEQHDEYLFKLSAIRTMQAARTATQPALS